MDEKIFDRIEKKYLITTAQKKALMKEIKKQMKKDAYFRSGVFNIYFDNDNFDLIIKSMERPEFKEKLRARSYEGYDKVFLEIKTKLKDKEFNVGYKRRVLITHKDFNRLAAGEKKMLALAEAKIETPFDLQIAKEVDYLIETFKLKPQILVYYDRESYVGENALRITFDSNLKYRAENLKFNKNSKDKTYFSGEKNIIMEIKAHGVMPLWLVKIMSAERIYPVQFSKIGKIYQQIRKEK